MIEVDRKMIERIVREAENPDESARCIGFMSVLAPCLKRNAKRRFLTAWGDKSEIGLYRSIRRLFNESASEQSEGSI